MAVRIIRIQPRQDPASNDPVLAHLGITSFQWINEESQQSGVASRELMFDWIVNKKGRAFIRKTDNTTIPIFGVRTATGQQYIRTVENEQWTNDLLSLPEINQ